MHRLKIRFLLLIVYVLFCQVTSGLLAAQTATVEKVTLSEDPWPPYILGEEGRAPTGGIAVDVLKRVFKNLSITLEMQLYPWQRSLYLVREGREDGHMLLVKSPSWDQYMVYSVPFIDDRFLLWSKKTEPVALGWQSFAELVPYSIGITHHYSYGEQFEQARAQLPLSLSGAKTDELNFKLLLGGRIDAFICLEKVANAIFQRNPSLHNRFVAAEKPIETLSLYMSLHKDSAAVKLMPLINQQLTELKHSGEIEKIIKNYH